MSRTLMTLIAVTDIAFILYWGVSGLYAGDLLGIPADWLFAEYHAPRAIAWNWSFFPLDMAVSLFGLWAIAAAGRGRPHWRVLAACSLVLCSAAGLMAIGYWALLREFEPEWFLPNLALFLWPIAFLPNLVCERQHEGQYHERMDQVPDRGSAL